MTGMLALDARCMSLPHTFPFAHTAFFFFFNHMTFHMKAINDQFFFCNQLTQMLQFWYSCDSYKNVGAKFLVLENMKDYQREHQNCFENLAGTEGSNNIEEESDRAAVHDHLRMRGIYSSQQRRRCRAIYNEPKNDQQPEAEVVKILEADHPTMP
jgi:hypothetical protein